VPSKPPHPGIKAVRSQLPDVVARFAPGAFLEDKGSALAVHTRRTVDPAGALAALRDPLGAMAVHHGLALEPGRLVLELRPPGTDKGAALTDLARETGAGSVLYAGDDLGDLRAFEAVLALRHQGVPGLRVCSANTEAPELAAHADLLVPGPEGVVTLLRELTEAVRKRGQRTP
jgi:trehalose 6-phosphate phosphatase